MGSDAPDTTTTRTTQEPWVEAGPLAKKALDWGKDLLVPTTESRMNADLTNPAGAGGYSPFMLTADPSQQIVGQVGGRNISALQAGGSRIADFTPEQMQAFSYANQMPGLVTNLMGNPTSSATGIADPSRINRATNQKTWAEDTVVNPTLRGDFLNPNTNPYTERVVQAAIDPMNRNLLENVMPALDTQANMAGRYGGSAWGLMKERAIDDYMKQVGDVSSRMYGDIYQGERQNQLNMAPYYQNVYNADVANLGQATDVLSKGLGEGYKSLGLLSSAGEEKQKMNQAEIEAAKQYIDEMLYKPYDYSSAIMNLAMGGNLGRSQTSEQPSYNPGFGQSLLGAAGTGLGLYGAAKEVGPEIASLFA